MNHLAILLPLFCLAISLHGTAQTDYQIPHSIFSNGGGYCSNEIFQLNGTVHQHFIGLIQTGTLSGKIGFWYQDSPDLTTYVHESGGLGQEGYLLKQNEPNPFLSQTTIGFELPKSGHVNLQILDQLGRRVMEVINDKMAAGYQEIQIDARNLGSGTYLYQLRTDQFSETRQMIITQ